MGGVMASACLRVLLCSALVTVCRAGGDGAGGAGGTLSVVHGPPPLVADLVGKEPPGEAFHHDEDYNLGRYGTYVQHSFKTANITAPRLNIMHSLTNCDDGSFIFVAPRGNAVEVPTAAIYDARGSLIWAPETRLGEVYNLQVQEYQGRSYITYWAGDNSGGHGRGFYYMLDQRYNVVRTISVPAAFRGDLHAFTITPEGTVIATAYQLAELDLNAALGRPMTGEKHFMWDCLFLEFDMDTGKIFFQWRASDHVSVTESYASHIPASLVKPWDYFHINMVEKDEEGNFLVCSRHLRSILYISGETGKVLWKLGGKANMFKDLSMGQATLFVGQHDAHWSPDHKSVTVFDNRADWEFQLEGVSKGRRVELDTDRMTAKVGATYVHPERLAAFSQGSYQTLPNGNVFLGYGFTGAFAEFAPNGNLLCDAYFSPSARFMSGDVQSYRSLKFNWTGIPDTDPAVVLDNSTLYVSWLGATEVWSWMVQDSIVPDDRFGKAYILEKTGFETIIDVSDDLPLRRYVRVVALDKDSKWLRTSEVLDIGMLTAVSSDHRYESDTQIAYSIALRLEQDIFLLGVLSGLVFLTAVLLIVFLWAPARRRVLPYLPQWPEKRPSAREMTIQQPRTPSSRTRLMSRLSMPRWRIRWLYKPLPGYSDD